MKEKKFGTASFTTVFKGINQEGLNWSLDIKQKEWAEKMNKSHENFTIEHTSSSLAITAFEADNIDDRLYPFFIGTTIVITFSYTGIIPT